MIDGERLATWAFVSIQPRSLSIRKPAPRPVVLRSLPNGYSTAVVVFTVNSAASAIGSKANAVLTDAVSDKAVKPIMLKLRIDLLATESPSAF